MLEPRPLSYRAEIIVPLMQNLVAGECCSVVGINGVGKTNMLQQLRRPDVIAHYTPKQGDAFAFCALDTNLLAEHTGWGFFEGLVETLRVGLSAVLPPDAIAKLAAAHAAILHASGSYVVALRSCALALDTILTHVRLVIIFDEFDPLFSQLPDVTLRNLRGLRDQYKYRLMYLTLSRERLTTLGADILGEVCEPFLELFTFYELGLHPLSAEDARSEVRRFAERHQRTLSSTDYERIVYLSGGHPSLLRALTRLALNAVDLTSEPRSLITTHAALRDECLKVWNDLTGDEQDVLWSAHGGGVIDAEERTDLLLKGLLYPDPQQQLRIFSPLVAALVMVEISRMTMPNGDNVRSAPIRINQASQQVVYYNQQIGDSLSPLNFRLLAYLYDHYGEVCSEEEVSRAIYEEPSSVQSERVATLVRRLVRKLREIAPHEPVLLQTIRGRGYRLGLPPY